MQVPIVFVNKSEYDGLFDSLMDQYWWRKPAMQFQINEFKKNWLNKNWLNK